MSGHAFLTRLTVNAAAIAVAFVATGCQKQPQIPPPPISGFNLVHEFDSASASSEKELIDFGEPEARQSMVQGWANDELWGRTPFVWSLGETTTLRFYLAEQRDITFEMSCWAFVAEGLPPQVVTVVSNGYESGEFELGSTFGPGAEYSISIPASHLVQGENHLTFRYAYTSQAADHLPGNTDRRPLAVAWDWLRLSDARDRGEPRGFVENGHRILELPFWTEMTYFLMLPPDAKLELEELVVWGGNTDEAHVEVIVEGRRQESRNVTLQQKSTEYDHQTHSISFETPTITRLTLRSNPGAGGAKGGVRLIEPAIITPPDSAPGENSTEGSAQGSSPPDFGTPNVLIYLIDALRADHLGCYGYDRPVSPNIDDFAANATVFDHAIAQSSWTKSTVGSIFSGMGPSRHGANTATDILPDDIDTLAERVQRIGWQTAGFITNGVVSDLFGFDQGFLTYVRLGEDNSSPEIHQLSDRLNTEIVSWLESRDENKPFFMYVHASDPHAPYYPRDPYRSRFAADIPPEIGLHDRVTALTQARAEVTEHTPDDLLSLYDAEIAFNDASFGSLIQAFEQHGVLDSTLVILMSDHGEEFFDHGRWEHGLTLFAEQLNIPLIIKFPSRQWQGARVGATVQQIDILPTVLEVAGAEPAIALTGRSLVGLVADQGQQQPPTVISVLDKVESRKVEAITWENFKLIHYIAYDQPRPDVELYNLTVDPGEVQNLAPDEPILVGYLKTLLMGSRTRGGFEAMDAELDDEMRSQLEALGYLDE